MALQGEEEFEELLLLDELEVLLEALAVVLAAAAASSEQVDNALVVSALAPNCVMMP